jgi:FtsP/CotA-like multicopper oxidase with cupredoxin domain
VKQPSSLAALTILCLVDTRAAFAAPAPPDDPMPVVRINDNRTPAGTRSATTLTLELRASAGIWRPEGDSGPALTIQAFGEGAGPLQIPAPLIRVPEGTEVVATIRNDLDTPLQVHGLCSRDGSPCPNVDVPPAGERGVRFPAGRAGTYHYWASSAGLPLAFRAVDDTQLSGAFVVDPPGGAAAADRVLVITDWTDLTLQQLHTLAGADDPGTAFLALNPRFTFLINGLSWPATERLTYQAHEAIRWRVVNLSTQAHPLHLHGFYFEVEAIGDGVKDTGFDTGNRSRVVTQLLQPGGTMAIAWSADRPGNWIFHCHISEHISGDRRLSQTPGGHGGHDGAHAPSAVGTTGSTAHGGPAGPAHGPGGGMAGMVLGVTILPPEGGSTPAPPPATPARRLTLLMRGEPRTDPAKPAYGFVLAGPDGSSTADKLTVPGPTLTLQRGEPVEITLVNQLTEATAIHWHGIELESYYDGVHGWSGMGAQVTPLIDPGQTFTVRFTPPHAGTFIYHTHLHDDHQLTAGMYGALIVLNEGETFDPQHDHVLVLGKSGVGASGLALLNGERDPLLVWQAGTRHRIRIINITRDDIFVVSLGATDDVARWRPLTKDGAPVPPSQSAARPASQTVAVGETFDFEFEAPPGRRALWLNVRTPAGRWQVQARVVVK